MVCSTLLGERRFHTSSKQKREDAESMYDMLQMIDGIVRMELRPTGLLDANRSPSN